MPHADRTMMRGTLRVPRFNKTLGANRKTVMTVRVSNAKHFAWDAFALCRQQFETASSILRDRKQRDRTVLDTHLNR